MIDVLAVAPHPDDGELWCGGYLAAAAAQGYTTGILDLTAGERSTRGTVETRRKEIAKATKVLKLKYRENLGFPDCGIGGLSPTRRDAQLKKLVIEIRKVRPKILLLPYWEERHPDHVEASRLGADAVFLAALRNYPKKGAPNPHRVEAVLYYQLRIEFEPSFYIDVSAHYDQKRSAILAYNSQIGTEGPEKHRTLLSDPLTLSAVEARDRYYGGKIGVKYAEGYLCRAPLGLSDPVEALCTESARSIQFFK